MNKDGTWIKCTHKNCGYTWLTKSRMGMVTCPNCQLKMNKQEGLSLYVESQAINAGEGEKG